MQDLLLQMLSLLLHLLLLVVGFLFVLDFPLPKPNLKQILLIIGIVTVTVGIIIFWTRFRVPPTSYESNPIRDAITEDMYHETEVP